MKTKEVFNGMEIAIPYISKLLESKEMKAFADEKAKGEMNGRDMLAKMLPVLFVKHPRETMGIIGAMNGKSADEIAEMDFEETAKLMRDDSIDNMYSFFIFSLRMGHLV